MCQTLSGMLGVQQQKRQTQAHCSVYIQGGEHKITGEDGIKKGKVYQL